jgi:hypothetical protein
MNTEDLVYWVWALTNLSLAAACATHFRRRIKSHSLTETRGKALYSWLCVGFSIASCAALFIAIIELQLSHGHGVIFIAVPIFSLLFAGVLIVAGRVAIGWEPIKW